MLNDINCKIIILSTPIIHNKEVTTIDRDTS